MTVAICSTPTTTTGYTACCVIGVSVKVVMFLYVFILLVGFSETCPRQRPALYRVFLDLPFLEVGSGIVDFLTRVVIWGICFKMGLDWRSGGGGGGGS